MILVDLMKGEQRHPSYLKINPQGKVPAIVVKNHDNNNINDCILYESQAIVEWLEDTFPNNSLMPSSSSSSSSSSSIDMNYDRINIKMWQYWELVLAEEIWPLSRQQVDGVIWRVNYSRDAFYRTGPPSQQSDDPFYKEKVSHIYEGIIITITASNTTTISTNTTVSATITTTTITTTTTTTTTITTTTTTAINTIIIVIYTKVHT